MGGLGLVWAAWTYFMARAYSLAQASMIASFEYLSLPINTLWGFLFGEKFQRGQPWQGHSLFYVAEWLFCILIRKTENQ